MARFKFPANITDHLGGSLRLMDDEDEDIDGIENESQQAPSAEIEEVIMIPCQERTIYQLFFQVSREASK